jgi:hypothetical protein
MFLVRNIQHFHYTVKDSHLLPRIDDTLDAFSGAIWYSTLDLKSGYHQVSIAHEDRPKTAFAFPGSVLWQFTVLAFGLCNAPAVFESLMLKILAELTWKTCLVYFDDIIVFAKTFEEQIKNLEEVLHRLKQANLKLNSKKCRFFQKRVTLLKNVRFFPPCSPIAQFLCLLSLRKKPFYTQCTYNQN